jgi:hypothetical protein
MQLEIDLSESDDFMVQLLADEAVAARDFGDWDHAYETLWTWLEHELLEQ